MGVMNRDLSSHDAYRGRVSRAADSRWDRGIMTKEKGDDRERKGVSFCSALRFVGD